MLRTHLAAVAILFLAQAAHGDPIVGKWSGTIEGPGGDHPAIAFDITADANGGLAASFYQPVLNVYGAPVTLTREGAVYSIPAFGAELTLDGDTLSGTATRLKFPMRLRRTDTSAISAATKKPSRKVRNTRNRISPNGDGTRLRPSRVRRCPA